MMAEIWKAERAVLQEKLYTRHCCSPRAQTQVFFPADSRFAAAWTGKLARIFAISFFLLSTRYCSTLSPVSFPDVLAGKVIRKIAPWGLAGETHKRPPCDSMIDRQIDRLIPIPSTLVVKKLSKILPISFGSMPLPESSTVICASPLLPDLDLMSIVRSATDSMASIALVTRLKSTCCSCARLAVTGISISSNCVCTIMPCRWRAPCAKESTSWMSWFKSTETRASSLVSNRHARFGLPQRRVGWHRQSTQSAPAPQQG